ncbi:MAG: hypothetical protein KH586_08705 [Tannerella sp.]|jgi:chromosome segregation ATPase|nr:hypothetical protein [Tannerella sp.]DAW68831.1 MAG TPA: hypothetical protein [Bacteriophage sp.]
MKTKTIAKVNNVDIVSTNDEQMVAIKPICEALGIDFSRQLKKIKEDENLSSKCILLKRIAQDGKERDMSCLPEKFIPFWILNICPKNVKKDVRDSLTKYQTECYNLIFEYFKGKNIFSLF